MRLRLPEYDSLFAWLAIGAAAVLLFTSCQSKGRAVGVVIHSDRYNAELYQAWHDSYAALEAVGAPVRPYNGDVYVTFTTCSTKGALGYGNGKGGHYALTLGGNRTDMCLAPDGSFQPAVARGELAHYHLWRVESADYFWARKAGLMP